MKIRVLNLITTSSVLVICFFLGSPLVKAQNDGDFYEKGIDHESGGKGASMLLKQGTSERGGDVELRSGEGGESSGHVAGDILIKAEDAYGRGGSIFLEPGGGPHSQGMVYIGNSKFNSAGSLTVPNIEVNGKMKLNGKIQFTDDSYIEDGNVRLGSESYSSGAGGSSILFKKATSDKGGDVELRSGEGGESSGYVAGDILIKAEDAHGRGGSIFLEPGGGPHSLGMVYIGNSKFNTAGNLTIDRIDADDINILQEIKIGPRYKPDLQIGKYTQGSLGSYSNPTMIASPVSVKRELILFGKKEGRLDLRMYDGSLKFGPDDDNLKAIIKRDGTAQFKELKIEDHPTADFVFEDDYNLRSLDEVDTYIKEHKHLPDIPSAEEMEDSGVNLAEMNKLLLQKIEELTLYAIEKEKEVEELQEKGAKQKAVVEQLKKDSQKTTARLEKIEALLEMKQ